MEDTARGTSGPRRRSLPRCLARIILGLGLGSVAVLMWFNVFFYPGYGLDGFGRQQYQAALLQVATGFAASESLTPGKIRWSQFRELGPQQTAFAWGTFLLISPVGERVNLWVSLRWSPFWQSWEREKCLWLADPRDRMFFAESLLGLGVVKKAYYCMQNLVREQIRRFREVWPR